jgi:enoyl-CoA hydratase
MNEVTMTQKDKTACITINRESAYNALNRAVMEALEKIFVDLENNPDIVVVVVTGAGQKAFVSGADITEVKDAGGDRSHLIRRGQQVFWKIKNSSKVVIAAVNGYALGGGFELALACDIRIAAENATFGFPEVKLGLMAGYGGTQFLPRLIGTGRAKFLMLTGEMIAASEAYALGIVEKICPRDRLMEEVDRWARKIASNGPLALEGCKKAIDGGEGLPLEEAMAYELAEYAKVAGSRDAEEGMSSFLEKRSPTFKGI